MRKVSGPSRRSLEAASRLGRKLARQERRLGPILRLATQFSSYDDFCLANRFAMESIPAFSEWENRIQKLAETEGNRVGYGLDKTIEFWDEFYTYIFTPIKHAFWLGWEKSWQLESTYRQMRGSHGREKQALTKVAHLSHAAKVPPAVPKAPIEKLSEEDRWEALAEKLFDDLEGDRNETLWNMPEAVSAGAKVQIGQA